MAFEIAFLPLHPHTGALLTLEKNPIYMLNSTCVMSPDGMRSRKLPVHGCDKNCERAQPVIGLGLPSSAVEGRWSRAFVAGVLNEVRQSGLHASFSVFDCDECSERKLLSFATHTRSRQGGRVGGYLSTCQ